MASKDVTRFFGSIRFVLPLLLIFFIAAGSAYACPNHTGKAAHRTKSLKTRSASYMAPVVISYGGRCADYGTRRAKYVSVRDNGYYEGGTRYVAVRRSVPRTRYVAVRADVDYAPRYVAVRNSVPRPKLVEVRHFDDGYARPTYVNVQRVPVVDDYFDRVRTTRAVAVRRVSNGCARVVTCGNRLDDVETTSMRRVVYPDNIAYSAPARRVVYRDDFNYAAPARHEVVKTDFIDGTEEVIYSSPIHDDTAYVEHVNEDVMVGSDVAYTAPAQVSYVTPAANLDVAYVATRNEANPCTPFEPTEPCSGAIARTVSYGTAAYNDIDFDDQAFLDTDDVTYVAAGDVEDACLSPVSYYEPAPVVTTRVVSHAKHGVAYDSFDRDVEPVFVDDPAPPVHNMAVVDDVDLVEPDVTFVADEADCIQPVAVQTCGDAQFETVTYVPVRDIDYVDTADTAYCPTSVSRFDDSEVLIDADRDAIDFDVVNADALNNGFAYNDGIEVLDDEYTDLETDAVDHGSQMDTFDADLYPVEGSV